MDSKNTGSGRLIARYGFKTLLLLVSLFLLSALIAGQVWVYKTSVREASEQFKTEARHVAEYIKISIIELVTNSEEGGAVLEGYLVNLNGTSESGINVRLVHSEALDIQFGHEHDENPLNDLERNSLKDGKQRDWQTDDYFVHSIPLIANVVCQRCHFAANSLEEVIPIGYPLALVEVKVPKTSLREAKADLLHNSLLIIGLILLLFFAFGFAIYSFSRELAVSEQKYSSIVNSVGDGILLIGKDAHIYLTNDQTCKIFGYSGEELIGKSIDTLIPVPSYRPEGEKSDVHPSECMPGVLGVSVELEGKRKDSSLFPIELRMEHGRGGENGGSFYTATVRDISMRKKMERELQRLAEFPKDDPDPILEIQLTSNTISYSNPACIDEFPELGPSPGEEDKGVEVDWDHPLLTGLKSLAFELQLDGKGKTLHAIEAEIGDAESEGYKVYGRQVRFMPEENILRVYTVDSTMERELLDGTQKLLEQVGKVRKELEDEHEEAETIGRSLLKGASADERINAFIEIEACSRAGGDRAGYITERAIAGEKDKDWLAVFDASGHGKGAAKFQEVALGGLFASLRIGNTMEDALIIVNATLEQMETGRFLVGNVWRVMHGYEREVENGYLWVEEYSIAQHHILLLEPGDNDVKEWEWERGKRGSGSTMPMGLFDTGFDGMKANYRKIKKGSRIITYTDGISEAHSKSGELFGLGRLKELILRTRYLPVEEAHKAIVLGVKGWVGELPEGATEEEYDQIQFDDDITIAIIDIKAKGD